MLLSGISRHRVIPARRDGHHAAETGGNRRLARAIRSPCGLKLQCEGHDVRYRNTWIKELNLEKDDTNFTE